MERTVKTFEHASAMPAPTWRFLNMNDTTIEVPNTLVPAPHVSVTGGQAPLEAADAFENALAGAQAAWEQTHPAPTQAELRKRAEFLAAEADATYGGTARSAYQAQADELEDARSLSAAFEHGLGDEAAAYLRSVAGDRIVVSADEGKHARSLILVEATPGDVSTAAIDVIANANSTIDVSIVVDGPDPASCVAGTDSAAPPEIAGVAGTTVRVFAGPRSHVNVTRVQTLGEGFADLDDTAVFAADDSSVSVSQTALGATHAYSGLAGDLRGDAARIDVTTRYLGFGNQKRDFNYRLRHHGQKTKCDLKANGVLAGHSEKTLRGTIDLVRGCKGSEGSENETVLLVDDDVRNKTVPVILCNEDDVAGNHGATIGHIRDEQLFYLTSRGLSPQAAERMFARALVEQAVIDAPDDAARAAAIRFGERMAPGFAELFEEV